MLWALMVFGCAPGPVAGQPGEAAPPKFPSTEPARSLASAPSSAASTAPPSNPASRSGFPATVAGSDHPGKPGPAADATFPFQYEALRVEGGGRLRLQSLEGQPVMVHFWASWCRPCIAEMPQLSALHARYADAGLRLVTVSVDESAAAMRAFLQRTPVPGMLLHDPSNEAALTFGVNNLPATFIYDRRGRLRYTTEHMMNAQDPVIHQALTAAVAQ